MKQFLLVLFCCLSIPVLAQDTTRISLLFAGDVMGHDSQIASAYDPVAGVYDYSSCFQFVRPCVESADLAIANLEVTLAGPPYKGYPQFSSPDALARELKAIGFDVLVTANNHCVDRGKQGLERTITMLDSFDIAHTGTFHDTVSWLNESPLLIQKNGIEIAILNYTYGTNGLPVPKSSIVNLIDTSAIRRDIRRAAELKPDIIIVFTHWGLEYKRLPEKPEKELTEFCFKQGAQLVVGSHPHVLQPMEWRKESNQFVAYSLGNFVSGQRKQYTDGGAMAYLELQKISFAPDSAVTTIDSAGYYLEWVYRTVDKDKDYYILPVGKVENDSISFIKDAASRAAYKTFVEDSRGLYRQHNVEVPERAKLPVRYEAKLPDDDR
jgi:poly-gamma-glutamate synthesis protein (capsule biosynthesis protein)